LKLREFYGLISYDKCLFLAVKNSLRIFFWEDKMKEKDKKTEISLNKLSMLKQTGSFLENIMESSMDVIVLTDSKGYILKVNKYFLELLGCKLEEVIGKHIANFGPQVNTTYTRSTGESVHISDTFFEETIKMYQRFVEEKKAINRQSYLVGRDDILIPVEQNMSFLHDEKGNVVGALAIIRDITERHQAEKQLRESRDFLENVIESSLDSIAVVDKGGLLIRVNDAFLKLTGFSKAEALEKHMSEFAPMSEGTYQCTTGEVIRLDEEYAKLVETNMLLFQEKGRMQNAISYMLRKDKKIVPVEDNMTYLVNKEGQRIGAVAITRDITERRKAEKDIQKNKEYLENIFRTSVDGIIISDANGRITEVNRATEKILGCPSDHLVGKHFNEMRFDRESLRVEGLELMQELFDKGVISGIERTWQKSDGTAVVIEMNIALLKNAEGTLTGSVASIRDVTERKKSEEALLESEEKYRGLINNIGIGVSLISPNMEILALNNQMQRWFPEADVSKTPICYKTFNKPSREKICSYCPTFKTLKDGQVHESITDTPRGDKTIHYRIVASPLKDKEGKITSAIEMVEDITKQKIAQEKLQESEEKYHNLIEHANDAIVSVNQVGVIIGFNKKAEEMFGYSHEEVMGKPSYLLISHRTKRYYKEALKQFSKTGTGLDSGENVLEGSGVRKGGEVFPLEYSYFTIKIKEEFIATAILRDISKRKEEEKRILNYQKQLQTLTSELILSEQKERQHFADFLHDEVGQQLFATRLQLEQLKKSLSSADNIKTLENALENLYRVMNQTRSLTSELSSPILAQLGLEKALEWLAEQAHKKYDILVAFEDDNQEKTLDDNAKILLYQSVSELLTNIAKHARTQNASISIKRNTSNVQVCVEDDGVGFLVPGKDSSDIKIEGLGLFRIKERLESIGGQMEIESQPNHGTRITLLMPLSEIV